MSTQNNTGVAAGLAPVGNEPGMEGRAGSYYGRFCERVEEHIARQERLKRDFHEAVKATRRAMGQDAYGRGSTQGQVTKLHTGHRPANIVKFDGTIAERNDLVRKHWGEREAMGHTVDQVAGLCGYSCADSLMHAVRRLGLPLPKAGLKLGEAVTAYLDKHGQKSIPQIVKAFEGEDREAIRYHLRKWERRNKLAPLYDKPPTTRERVYWMHSRGMNKAQILEAFDCKTSTERSHVMHYIRLVGVES